MLRYVLGGLLLTAGCSAGAVQVPTPSPSPDAAAVRLCGTLKLPDRLNGLDRRETDPGSPLVAAWGTPAISLRCGVARPADPATGNIAQVDTINGTDWYALPGDPPVTWTLVGRQVYVEVTIPRKYPADTISSVTDLVKDLPKLPEGTY
ncbi:MAG: DUF3515 domain-containing protein [Streptosporangiaceae bacterium]